MTDQPGTNQSGTDQPGPDQVPAGRGRRGWWRSRRTPVLLALLGGGLALLGQGRAWATGHGAPVAGTVSPLTLDGGSAAPGVSALALVALAAAVALATAGRAARQVVAALLALAGVALVWLVVAARSSPQTLRSAIEAATGTTGGTPTSADGRLTWTPWPVVAAAGGVVIVAAAALALRWSGSWPGPSARYERGAAAPGPAPGPVADPWEALSRGEDPTNRPG